MQRVVQPKLLGMLPEEVENAFYGIQLPKFRADQVLQWIYQKNVTSFDQMTNLSVAVREQLKSEFEIGFPNVAEERLSPLDGSGKFLIRLQDGQYAETVLIKRGVRRTVCVSSQVGCKFKCVFCASGQAGFGRNLTPDEIVAQVACAVNMNQGERVSHVVFMGMGEPMDNLPSVIKAIKILNHPKCFGIGARRITVSTSGIVSKFETLEREGLQVELSVSLHGADDKVRGKLMPVNRKWPVKDLIKACHEYTVRTNRQITFEYLLADGLNAYPEQAKQLAQLLKGMICKVNLIPLNPIPEFPYTRPSYKNITVFQRILRQSGIAATVRFSRGGDISAACGQLRRMRQDAK